MECGRKFRAIGICTKATYRNVSTAIDNASIDSVSIDAAMFRSSQRCVDKSRNALLKLARIDLAPGPLSEANAMSGDALTPQIESVIARRQQELAKGLLERCYSPFGTLTAKEQ